MSVEWTVQVSERKSFKIGLDPGFYSQGIMMLDLLGGHLYEKDISILLSQFLEDGDGFVDIGAHRGWFTLLAASLVGDRGYVVAVEPMADNVEALRENVNRNGWGDRVECICAAAGSTDGVVEFYPNVDNEGGGALWDVSTHPFNQKTRETRPGTITVPMVTLDKILDDMPVPVKAIKIDTEGAEVEVLKGAQRWLRSGLIPHIFAEVHAMGLVKMGSDPDVLGNLMSGYGYRCFILGERKPDEIFNVLFSNSFKVDGDAG